MMIRRYPWVTAFTALYVLGFIAMALYRKNTEFLFYGAVMLVIDMSDLGRRICGRDSRRRWCGCFRCGVSPHGRAVARVGQRQQETVALYSYWLVRKC
ncbi:MAG: hypothetical protein R3B46_14590 [Phycisphaerales bacterium]